MMRIVQGREIYGVEVDAETRCAHWRSDVDIIAIKFRCCGRWYACFDCHAAVANHTPEVWPKNEFAAEAVLCGACGHGLSIDEYLGCESICPHCKGAFNPGCSKHRHLYFES